MWRAWPMPSANIVAQKPAGSVNPLSSFEHLFCAHTGEAMEDNVESAMMTNKQGLYRLNNRIELSRDGLVTEPGQGGAARNQEQPNAYHNAGVLEAARGRAGLRACPLALPGIVLYTIKY